jgi:glycosyltransferase involved in cell wall biosynthesis
LQNRHYFVTFALMIFHIVSNKEWGGGEQYVYDLCRRQQADGIKVSVFCKPVEDICAKFREAGISVQTLTLGGVADFRSGWRMADAINGVGPCTIHAHNFKDAFTACYARRLTNNKDVRVVMCRHLTRTGKNTIAYRWLYRQLDALCFDSELSRSMFLSTHPAIDEKKLTIVHTSIVVPDSIRVAPLRQELNIPADAVLAMYHGRLDPEKGIDVLIEAAAILRERNFRLVLIGRGSNDYTTHLQQHITQKGLQKQVLLAGFRHPVLPYVAAADFGVLASTVCEGCPLSPQEYMSQGRPVIVTDNGGQREYVVEGHNGLLVPPGDAQALATAMGRLIDNDSLRHQLGSQAKADFDDHLNYEHFYSQIIKLYDD